MNRRIKVSKSIGPDIIWQSRIKSSSNLFSAETMIFLRGITTFWTDI